MEKRNGDSVLVKQRGKRETKMKKKGKYREKREKDSSFDEIVPSQVSVRT